MSLPRGLVGMAADASVEGGAPSFPRQQFPLFAPSRTDTALRHSKNAQDFNTSELGRLAGFAVGEGARLLFKRDVWSRYICYKTPCLPLLPPNTRMPYDEALQAPADLSVPAEISFFRHNFPFVYVPTDTLTNQLQQEHFLASSTADFDSTLGNLLSFLPYSSTPSTSSSSSSPSSSSSSSSSTTIPDQCCIGCVFYPSGPNLESITLGVLLRRSDVLPPSSPLFLRPLQAWQLPGRALQLDAVWAQGRPLLAVRCHYYVAIFEGPSLESLLTVTSDNQSPKPEQPGLEVKVQLMSRVTLLKSVVMTSCFRLSPYIAGEGVMVSESGAVYQWTEGEGLSTLQMPLTTPSSSDPVHFWQCCYGNHPRCLVLAEHAGVALGDFRTGHLLLTPLLTWSSPALPPPSFVTALAPLHSHPRYVAVTTTELLLLLDLSHSSSSTLSPSSPPTAPSTPPLLTHRHEARDSPRHICSLTSSTGDSLLLLSTNTSHASTAFSVCLGGSGRGSGCGSAPRFTSSPHLVANYSELVDGLHASSLLPFSSSHFRQPLSGSLLVDLQDGTFAALVLSSLGDMFCQVWCYQDHAPTPPPAPASTSSHPHCRHWLGDAQMQETLLGLHQEPSGFVASHFNLSPLFDYVVAAVREEEPSLCLSCHFVSKNCLPDFPMTEHLFPESCDQTDQSHARVGGQFDAGTIKLWRTADCSVLQCAFCGCRLEEQLYQRISSRSCSSSSSLAREREGLDALRAACAVSPPKQGLGRQLWDGWREERSCSEQASEGGVVHSSSVYPQGIATPTLTTNPPCSQNATPTPTSLPLNSQTATPTLTTNPNHSRKAMPTPRTGPTPKPARGSSQHRMGF